MLVKTWGAHWRVTPRYTGNEGPCNVEVDELFWQGYYLIAATHGRGIVQMPAIEYNNC